MNNNLFTSENESTQKSVRKIKQNKLIFAQPTTAKKSRMDANDLFIIENIDKAKEQIHIIRNNNNSFVQPPYVNRR